MTYRLASALLLLTLSLAACSNVASTPEDAAPVAEMAAQAVDPRPAQQPPLRVDVLPPTISSISPVNGAIGLPPIQFTISATFSEPMNTTSVENAFQLAIPKVNKELEVFTWNANNTAVSMKYLGGTNYGGTVVWKIGAGATDVAGNPLSQTGTVGGNFRAMRQNTVKLYSDPAKDLGARRDFADGFGSFSSADQFGMATAEVGWRGSGTQETYERAFLQFSLSKLPDMSTMTKLDSASFHFNRINETGHLGYYDGAYLENITTPAWFQESSLWNASEATSPLIVLPLGWGQFSNGNSEVDITDAFTYDLAHSASLFGLSQWRIRMSNDWTPTQPDGDYHFTMALGGNWDPARRPYIEVTYEYP